MFIQEYHEEVIVEEKFIKNKNIVYIFTKNIEKVVPIG